MSVQRVIDHTRHMNELHLQLLELGQTKRKVLIKNDLEQLTAIVQRESQLARTISETEKQWLEAARSFFILHGREPGPELTVSDILQLIDDEKTKDELQQARSELMGTMHELKQVNALNQQLIEQSLALIEYTIELIAGAPEEEMTYQNPHDLRRTDARSVFDRKT